MSLVGEEQSRRNDAELTDGGFEAGVGWAISKIGDPEEDMLGVAATQVDAGLVGYASLCCDGFTPLFEGYWHGFGVGYINLCSPTFGGGVDHEGC